MQSAPFVHKKPSAALSAAGMLYLIATIISIMLFLIFSIGIVLIIELSAIFGPGKSQPEADAVFLFTYLAMLAQSILGAVGTNAIHRRTSFTRAIYCGWAVIILSCCIAAGFSMMGFNSIEAAVCVWTPLFLFAGGLMLAYRQEREFPSLVLHPVLGPPFSG